MKLGDVGKLGKLRQHMTNFTLTMNKIFGELHRMSEKIDEQSKVLNALLEAVSDLEEKIGGCENGISKSNNRSKGKKVKV